MGEEDFMIILNQACEQDEMSLDSYLNLKLYDKIPYNLTFKKENVIK